MKNIPKIEKYSFYVDTTFNRLSKMKYEFKLKNPLEAKRITALKKMEFVRDELSNWLEKIAKSFPSFTSMDSFYINLIKLQFKIEYIRKSISSLNGSKDLINDFYKKYSRKVRGARQPKYVSQSLSEYFGKVKSVMKKLKKTLEDLENLRKYMRTFPVIKNNPTISIAGVPNVGKTTLFTKMTNSFPEINSYPFTTKQIMVGYYKTKKEDLFQILDTPGALNRKFNEMNHIEKQSIIALKFLAQKVIFVFDLTGYCGYDIKEQESLLRRFREKYSDKDYMIYFSKKDLFKEEEIENQKHIINKFSPIKTTDNFDDLKKILNED